MLLYCLCGIAAMLWCYAPALKICVVDLGAPLLRVSTWGLKKGPLFVSFDCVVGRGLQWRLVFLPLLVTRLFRQAGQSGRATAITWCGFDGPS